MMSCNRCRTLLFVTALIAVTLSAHAAPITFNTALPVSKGEIILRQQLIVSQSSDSLGSVARDVTVIKGVSVIGYGAARGLAVFGVLPVVNIDRDIGGIESSATGLDNSSLGVVAMSAVVLRTRMSPGSKLMTKPPNSTVPSLTTPPLKSTRTCTVPSVSDLFDVVAPAPAISPMAFPK